MRSPLAFFRRNFDPLADAADRMERTRQAREVIGDPLADSPLGVIPMRRPGGRWMWAYLGGALVIGAIVSTTHLRKPDLPANCHVAALKLSTDAPSFQQPVAWTATGPVGDYVLTADVTAVNRIGVRELSVAEPTTGDSYLGPQFRMDGCSAGGRFSLDLNPGRHTVRLFSFGASGAKVVVERTVTVKR